MEPTIRLLNGLNSPEYLMLETIWRATRNISMTFQKPNLPLTLAIPYSGIWVVLWDDFFIPSWYSIKGRESQTSTSWLERLKK